MRAAAAPGFRVGIAARGFLHPGEELLRQCARGGLHGGPNYTYSAAKKSHAGRSIVLISIFDSSV
jgi:hypothetical protein